MNINKYKFSSAILNLIIGGIALLLSFKIKSEAKLLNSINHKPEPGGRLWQKKDEGQNADFDSGFSNIELGGYLEFEYGCKTSSGLAESEIKYWFRLSDRLNHIGTVRVEFGCCDEKGFLHTYTSTNIKSSLEYVDCLQVKSPGGGGLMWFYSHVNLSF